MRSRALRCSSLGESGQQSYTCMMPSDSAAPEAIDTRLARLDWLRSAERREAISRVASVIAHLIGTFFNGSRAAAIAALVDETERPLSTEERAELAGVIRRLRAEGK